MRLEQGVHFDMGVRILWRVDRDRCMKQETSQHFVFSCPDWQIVELCCGRENLDQSLHLCFLCQRCRKELNGCEIHIVIGRDHSQVQRREMHLVFDGNHFGLLQFGQRRLHQIRQMVRKMSMCDALEIVVVGILPQPAVEKRPRQVIDSILFVFDRSGHNLGGKVIAKKVIQVTFDREGLKEEFLVVLFSRSVAHEDAATDVIFQWPTGMSHHLKKICDGIVCPA